MVFSFFPPGLPVNKTTMNWSVVVFSSIVIFGLVYYSIWGRKQYHGPVMDRQFTTAIAT
jgi:hypothetical protein